MEWSDAMEDRAAGVLLGQAIGDALGVPYEGGMRFSEGHAEMLGGGLGGYEPGEWSDDTQMALCIAQVAATGADLTTPDALDAITRSFIDWMKYGASDIGNQTATVLFRSTKDEDSRLWERATRISEEVAGRGSAGNGGLMRTAVVGLSSIDSEEKTAKAAGLVCALTHAEERCVESSVLWSVAVRHAVLTGEMDPRRGLPYLEGTRAAWWSRLIDEAEAEPPETFVPNGYTVTAFQAAWSSIHATRHIDGPDRFAAALQWAIAIGSDTDTVAAIAGGLLGAAYGASQLPTTWAEQVHGWPVMTATDLTRLGVTIAGFSGRE
ncbi:MAG: ADP-ribosylglycohydrolase family protein [Propionibacteriaceae bacterium]|jgi:ADP-ribosylglycohydrolase|nr:ADP-ribosylglycohydrolase family protein [Propionibacteriaceae bacterium]